MIGCCWSALWLLSCYFTSTEARWPIRDGDKVGRGRESEGSTTETVRKRPERPWTAARTMEVLRRCPLAVAQPLVHCTIAVSTAVLDRVTKTMSVALLLTNNLDNSKQKTSNLLSPAPTPYSWSLLGKCEGPAPPPTSKISWSFDLAWKPVVTGRSILYSLLMRCWPAAARQPPNNVRDVVCVCVCVWGVCESLSVFVCVCVRVCVCIVCACVRGGGGEKSVSHDE